MEGMVFGTEQQFGIQNSNNTKEPRLSYSDAAKEIIAANNQMLMYGIHPQSGEGGKFRSWLYNGGLLYHDDVKHPEYSTPECKSLGDLITYEMAGRRIAHILISLISRPLRSEGMLHYSIFANNTDHYLSSKNTSCPNVFGYHENYSATHPEGETKNILPFLATRHIYAGAGFIASDALEKKLGAPFLLAQRALAVNLNNSQELLVGGYYNKLVGPSRHNSKILHVTIGDANLSTFATGLKIGTTLLVHQLVHQLLEGGWKPPLADMSGSEVVSTVQDICRYPNHQGFKGWICKIGGKTISAIDIQRVYFSEAEKRFFGRDKETNWVLYHWRQTLDQLEKDPLGCDGLDWVIKKRFFDSHYRSWTRGNLVRFDIAYHSADPDRSAFLALARSCGASNVVDEKLVQKAMEQPPQNTRAYGRGVIVRAIAERIRKGVDKEPFITWDEVSYAGQKVPMPQPFNAYRGESESFIREIEGGATSTKERR